ncbi:MAG: GtrA family protein, partial [Deltaproteobacteria bacterium]|nr:GtrA family protein [Deltaproteobacteria bacterium]
FCLIGGSGMMVDITSVYLSMQIFMIFGIVPKLFQFRIARVIGFVFAVTTNFLLTRRFTFSRAEERNIYRQYLSCFMVSLIGFTVNWFVSIYLYEHVAFFNMHYLIAAFTGILGGTAINFTGSKLFVFKHRKSHHQQPEEARKKWFDIKNY